MVFQVFKIRQSRHHVYTIVDLKLSVTLGFSLNLLFVFSATEVMPVYFP